MTDNDYRDIIRKMPCYFCGVVGDQVVSWHHLKCLGQSGTGMKPPSWATIPICDTCHKKCHSYQISRKLQVAAMMTIWVEIGCLELGVEGFFKRIGAAYAETIGLEE